MVNDVWRRKVTAEDRGIMLEEQLSSLALRLRSTNTLWSTDYPTHMYFLYSAVKDLNKCNVSSP